jgi:hypothetical protein
MTEARWKDALRYLLNRFPWRRLTTRVALSASLLGLAQSTPDAAAQPRVPVSPLLIPEVTVRKFKGRYVLKRAGSAFFMHLAGHRSHSSHSSHSSHASHSSHSSSSHYSNAHSSHFSSSTPPPPRDPAPEPVRAPQPVVEPTPIARSVPEPKPLPLLRDAFETSELQARQWRIGVIATAAATFDSSIAVEQTGGALSIMPASQQSGAHFSGYVSIQPFDLNTCSVAVQLRRPSIGANTLFAVAIDSGNWVGFRVEGGQLAIESHTNQLLASRKIPYSAAQHRYLRLRTSNVAAVVVWETSADGEHWTPQYVEKEGISVKALHIALSAGTTASAASTGPAVFDNVVVERKR